MKTIPNKRVNISGCRKDTFFGSGGRVVRLKYRMVDAILQRRRLFASGYQSAMFLKSENSRLRRSGGISRLDTKERDRNSHQSNFRLRSHCKMIVILIPDPTTRKNAPEMARNDETKKLSPIRWRKNRLICNKSRRESAEKYL